MPRHYQFVLCVLAVWRITHLLQAEDGPGKLLVRFRLLAGNGFWGELLDCFYCLSLWVAAPFALLGGAAGTERLLLWPALSAAAILLERATAPAPAIYHEEEPHELLRPMEEFSRNRTEPAERACVPTGNHRV